MSNQFIRQRNLVSLAVASAILGAPVPLLAQQGAEASGGLEEIVVTAQRREQNLQETPVTVTAITAGQLEDLGISNVQDVAKNVPNLQMLPLTASPSTFQIGLRGGVEQTGGLIVSEPAVGIYVDDVYRGRLQGANMQLLDVERIEVLRGPQGTLYGRNTFSGAIKVVTRTPSADNAWADLSASFGSFSESIFGLSVGGGLGGNLGASFAALYRDQADGWMFNRARQSKMGREENVSLRGKLVWDNGPTNVTLSLAYGTDENDGYIPAAIRFDPPTVPSGPANAVSTDNVRPRFGNDAYVTEYPQETFGDMTTLSATLDISHDFGGWTLRSITGYVDLEDNWRWDIAGGLSPAPGVYSPSFDRTALAKADQLSQELQALGKGFDDRLDWIVGAYYFTESGDQSLTDDIPLFFLRNLAPTFLTIDTDSWAVFGQASWKFSDRVSATIGGRYTQDDKSFTGSIQSGFGAGPPRTTVSLDESFDAFTPKAGLDVRFSDDVFGYLSASRGFKAGGFNGLAVLNPAVFRAVYGPQEVWTYEAGIKADWLDRRLRTNIAVFSNDIEGLQQTATVGAGSFATQNVGDATVNGVEAEITAQPTDGLSLFLNLGYMDGKYDSLSPASQAAQAGATQLPLVTDWTATYGFAYDRPIGANLLFRVGASARYIGDHFVETTNAIEVKAYSRYDAFVGVGTQDGRWDLRLSGKNLSDEVSYVTGFVTSTSPALATLRPRTWALTINWRK